MHHPAIRAAARQLTPEVRSRVVFLILLDGPQPTEITTMLYERLAEIRGGFDHAHLERVRAHAAHFPEQIACGMWTPLPGGRSTFESLIPQLCVANPMPSIYVNAPVDPAPVRLESK